MQKAGFPDTDKLYELVGAAYDASWLLSHERHYRSCDGVSGRPNPQSLTPAIQCPNATNPHIIGVGLIACGVVVVIAVCARARLRSWLTSRPRPTCVAWSIIEQDLDG